VARPRSRRLRRGLRVLLAVAILVVALFSGGAGFVVSLPGVGDAEQRVGQILRAHRATDILDGAGRAALASLHAARDPGGSTIAQQLAKQLYIRADSLRTTLEEIGLGVKLSLTYSKPRVLEMYLNAVYFGHGYWGDVAAARGYFGASPGELNWGQAAMLAGLPQAPSAYDPVRHLTLARERQRHVLARLVATGTLTPRRAALAAREPLHLRQAQAGSP
jgi:membrane peptidoglycan carboxypeptidase